MMMMMQVMKMFMIKTLHCDRAPIESCIEDSLAVTGTKWESHLWCPLEFPVLTCKTRLVRAALFTCGAWGHFIHQFAGMLGRPCQVHFSQFSLSIQVIQMSVDPFVLCSILSKKVNFTSELTSSYRGSWRAQSRGKAQQVWAWQRGLCSPSQSPRQAWTESAPASIDNWTIFWHFPDHLVKWTNCQHRRYLHTYHHGLHLSLLHVVVAPLEQVLHGGLLVRVEHHHGRHPLLTLRVAKANHRTILQRKKILKALASRCMPRMQFLSDSSPIIVYSCQ